MNRIGPSSVPSVPEVSSSPDANGKRVVFSDAFMAVLRASSTEASPLCTSLWDFKVKPREHKLCSSTEVDELSKEYDCVYRKMQFLEVMDVMTNMQIEEPFMEYGERLLEIIDEYKRLSERSVTIADKSSCCLWCF